MKKDLTRLSKFLAVILRHSPENFGIKLDEQGFTSLPDVWEIIENKFKDKYSLDDIKSIVIDGDKSGKKRYEIMDGYIRAMYGHSQPEIVYPSVEPPAELFHGTNEKALSNIRKHGLLAGRRQYVHMTTNLDTARIVSTRRTSIPIILTIRAIRAYENGVIFHNPENEIYLSKAISIEYIAFPQ